MKRILLIGATGSVGSSACDVMRALPGEFRLVALAARTNRAAAFALAEEFGARAYVGEDAAVRAVAENDADIALVATVGLSGLAPTLAAIEKGMQVALATKEVLVAAGELVTARARAKGVRILPIDSEHSAIFQCLQGAHAGEVERLLLTASGGPFLKEPADLASVTPAQALHHPRWNMGPKVTIDSATMMNKGFELLEAHWLFGVPMEHIEVVVHPESIVHSLVTFTDGATLAQLSPPDMRLPIQYALTWPARLAAPARGRLDLVTLGSLSFHAPDVRRFPCLRLVKKALALGGTATAALSAADEVAVRRFLAGDIRFSDIPCLLESTIDGVTVRALGDLDAVLAADREARAFAASWNA